MLRVLPESHCLANSEPCTLGSGLVNGGFEKAVKLPPIGYKYTSPSGWQGKNSIVIKSKNGPWGGLSSANGNYFVGIQNQVFVNTYNPHTQIHALTDASIYPSIHP